MPYHQPINSTSDNWQQAANQQNQQGAMMLAQWLSGYDKNKDDSSAANSAGDWNSWNKEVNSPVNTGAESLGGYNWDSFNAQNAKSTGKFSWKDL